jgi:hypothetical protein
VRCKFWSGLSAFALTDWLRHLGTTFADRCVVWNGRMAELSAEEKEGALDVLLCQVLPQYLER